MSAKTYRKKPVTVEAIQWKGNNLEEVAAFVGKDDWGFPNFTLRQGVATLWVDANGKWLTVEESEWILKDKLGYYPCKNEMFEHSYEEDKA